MIKIADEKLDWIVHWVRLDDESVTRERVADFLKNSWNFDDEEAHQEWMTNGDPLKIADWVSMNFEIGRWAEDEDGQA